MTRDEQKSEALERLHLLRIPEHIVKEFDKNDIVCFYDGQGSKPTPVPEQIADDILSFEKVHDATVYLVIRQYSFFGVLDSLIFISKYPEEWEEERDDIGDGYLMTYTINRDTPQFSEFGSICFRRTKSGIIYRIA